MVQRYKEAVNTFEHCLTMGESNLRHLTMNGAGSFRAWHYMGKCWAELGNWKKAEKCYIQSLELAPTFAEAAADLHNLRGDH
ncbi:tetratricopeptide repeat protein [Paenibacillus senegalensis]|uniref:tetratricopeptide repeat protein n=1 Tax=Paenibacillus senegalensis TaxID=1465766 RepID=UPI000289CA1F|nr:tetratricopeptide repeat protein [Paenibacillus senegalensis]